MKLHQEQRPCQSQIPTSYKQPQDSSPIKRIYLCSPIQLNALRYQGLNQHKLGDSLRFVALATQKREIQPFMCESISVISSILQIYTAERDGKQPKIIFDKLSPDIRSWLVLKGFTEDAQIKARKERGNSLMHSLLMLVVSLPYCPKEYRDSRTARSVHKSTTYKPEQRFDRKQLEQVRELYQHIQKKPYPESPSQEDSTEEANIAKDESRAPPLHETDDAMSDLEEIVNNFIPEKIINTARSMSYMEDDELNRDHLEDSVLGTGEDENHQFPPPLRTSDSHMAVSTDIFRWSDSIQSCRDKQDGWLWNKAGGTLAVVVRTTC